MPCLPPQLLQAQPPLVLSAFGPARGLSYVGGAGHGYVQHIHSRQPTLNCRYCCNCSFLVACSCLCRAAAACTHVRQCD